MRGVRLARPSPGLAAVAAGLLLAGCGGGGPGPQPAHPDRTAAGPARHRSPARGRPAARRPAWPLDLRARPRLVAARAHVPILCYHQIRDWRPSDAAIDRPYIMPPRVFRAQMAALAARGYHPIGPRQLLSHLTTGRPLPRRPVMLTFDDADEQQFSVALPVLRRHRFTATFFVMTVVLGHRDYMSARQVRRLDAAGMTIGAHTWDHHRVDEYAGRDWRVQIDAPTRELARIVGHPVRWFAYPYGAWSPRAFPHLRRAGYLAAFQLTDHPLDPRQPRYTLRRQIASPFWSTRQFLQALAQAA